MRLGQPTVQFAVKAGPSTTTEEALGKLAVLVRLCRTYKVRIVDTHGSTIVLCGKRRNVANFQRDHAVLSKIGVV